jgi:hypothetical protein
MAPEAQDAPARVARWAAGRADIAALVQIGSRVQEGGAAADAWSDHDFHLVTRAPAAYSGAAAVAGLGEAWAVSSQPVFGGVRKLTVVLADAVEVDLAVLPLGPVRIAFAALRFPRLARLWPAPLRAGIRDLRIVAAPGWRVVQGGAAWERRYARLGAAPPWPQLTADDLAAQVAAFDAGLVWVVKKLRRGEGRAAQREFHRTLLERTWVLIEHEARARGAAARPEARRAESWLPPALRDATAFPTSPDPAVLGAAVLRVLTVFDETAARLGASAAGAAPLRAWVRAQLAEVPGTDRNPGSAGL